MKFVLSRKGFDSSAGGCPSPILPDGQTLSLPIPGRDRRTPYSVLNTRTLDVCHLVSDLTRGRVRADASVHLDPDLESSARNRESGWLPAFGQDSNAQRHLDRAGVGLDDLFLFFGWFPEVEFNRGRYRYREHVPDLHVLFGWLRIGQSCASVRTCSARLQGHPHAVRDGFPFNTVYVAKGAEWCGSVSHLQSTARTYRSGQTSLGVASSLRFPAALQTSTDVPRVSVTLERRSRRMSASEHGTGRGVRAEPRAVSWRAKVG